MNHDCLELIDIITALCGRLRLCTVCYRHMEGMNCSKCEAYYTDCSCEPLTKTEIENYMWEP